MTDRFVAVATVSGRADAEILKSYLQANGVGCELSQEAAGWIHGFTVSPLGDVDLLVPSHQRKQAAELIKLFRGQKAPPRN